MEFVALLIYVFVVVIFCTGGIHFSHYLTVYNEKKKQHLSISTNGKEGFVMQVEAVQNAFVHKRVTGRYKGVVPEYHDVLLLDNKKEKQPVMVLKVKKGAYNYQSNSIELSIVLFGAKEKFLMNGCNLTNIREKEAVVVKKELSVKANSDIQYPVKIKSTLRDYFNALLVLVLGVFETVFIVANMVVGSHITFSDIMVFALGAIFTIFGLYMLASAIIFSISLDEDGRLVLVRLSKTKTYKRKEYSYGVRIMRSNGKESYELHLDDVKEKKLLATISDSNPQFNQFYSALKEHK